MSDTNIPTPRTDAQILKWQRQPLDYNVERFADFTRTLERELSAAIADCDLYKRLSDERFAAIVQGANEIRALREALAKAQATQSTMDGQCERDLASVRAELAEAKQQATASDHWASECRKAVVDRNATVDQLDLMRDELARISARIVESGLSENPNLACILDYCQRSQSDITRRFSLIEECDTHKARADKLERELADADSREAHNLQIAIDEAKAHKARADRWEKVAEQSNDSMRHILEYWNRDQNESAMRDALWHIIEVAADAIADYDAAKKAQNSPTQPTLNN